MKHDWRKLEKTIYLPKNKPEVVNIPEYKFLTIEGAGNPNSDFFSECISALYSMAYAVKMAPKKQKIKPRGYYDYTVYPLEGIWDINEKAKEVFDGTINKNDLVFKLMIRQPGYLDASLFGEMLELTKEKKPQDLLNDVKFEKITDGMCVQMLHIGSYDAEPASFRIMEVFSEDKNLKRISKSHREVYLSDFRKVAPEKLKTVLRFGVENKK
jgi:hypothetical protein